MSEFEKELDAKIKSGEIMEERYKNGCIVSYFASFKDIVSTFKDWQPPKPQQALPVVPEDVDKAIKYLKNNTNSTFSDLCDILTNKGLNWLNDFQFKDRRFGFGGLNNKLFILSHLAITGYTVEKPQLFYLKNKIKLEDVGNDLIGYLNLFLTNNGYLTGNINRAKKFTKQEIDSMQTGSYEKIEVEP